jgi:hypothetical protein
MPHAGFPRPCVNEPSLDGSVDEHMLQPYVSCIFRCMLHMFHLNIVKINLVLYILQWLYTCVVSICFKGFSCFKHMLQVFHLDVAYIAVAIHICCNCVFQMFQLFHLDLACFHLDVAYVAVSIHVCCKCMLQMFNLFLTYVASVLSRCCIYIAVVIHICCKRMFQLFQYGAAGAASHALSHAAGQAPLLFCAARANPAAVGVGREVRG